MLLSRLPILSLAMVLLQPGLASRWLIVNSKEMSAISYLGHELMLRGGTPDKSGPFIGCTQPFLEGTFPGSGVLQFGGEHLQGARSSKVDFRKLLDLVEIQKPMVWGFWTVFSMIENKNQPKPTNTMDSKRMHQEIVLMWF